MVISKSQHRAADSCKVVRGRCNCRSNRNNIMSLLLFVLLAAISMLATGLAEPFESTTLPTDVVSTVTEVVKQDERLTVDHIQFGTASDELEDSYVSLSEGGLEQEIRDAVRSEVESEIEAGASDLLLSRQEDHSVTPQQIIVTSGDNNQATENTREPKTLETNAGLSTDAEAQGDREKESEFETSTDSETAESRHRPLPNVTSDLVSVIFNEDRAITEQPIAKTNLLALEQEHKDFELKDTTPAPVYDPPKHQVTKKQGVEDLLPIEVPDVPEIDTEIVRDDRKIEPLQETSSEPVTVTPLPDIEENIIDNEKSPQPEMEVPSSPKLLVALEAVETEKEVIAEVETTTTIATESDVQEEAESNDTAHVEPTDDTEETTTISDIQEKTTTEENRYVETNTDIVYNEATTIKSIFQERARPKDESIDRADDSTATPLVSYPPHDAGQTFDSNLADERTAHLSLASTNRSTLIIALCSGTAVIFIIISLVIFVVSFQRQHGTLDIEMQEQRHGKDTLDEEDAQMKLLDVDLSTPVILVSMGTEETDECL